MPALNRIADFAPEMTEWRRHLHANPELGFDCHQTAAFVVDRLREMGITEIETGIAESGVVALIEGSAPGPTIGLRADMDALPIVEETGAGHASTVPGKMHACGHDGHTTMLLGAARYLSETRNFAGRVALIFQPAEEFGGGGRVMREAGILDRYDVSEVYAIHCAPDFEAGTFHTRPGPIMAAVDEFEITVTGKGGHAAYPHTTADPVACALQIGQALNSIVSRNTDPIDNLVVSLTQIHGGSANNVIPQSVRLSGTVRSFRPGVQAMVQERIAAICTGSGLAMGCDVALDYQTDYPATVNDPDRTAFAAEVARDLAGDANVDADTAPMMGAEDFSYLLEARPGAYVFLGQGIGPFCHHPAFDFNDEVAPLGASFLARLVERASPLPG
jgi:hippurate hydrolase